VVESGGVEPQKLVENTEVIEYAGRTTRERCTKSSSAVHGMYTKHHALPMLRLQTSR
jgi:hypothetical protein